MVNTPCLDVDTTPCDLINARRYKLLFGGNVLFQNLGLVFKRQGTCFPKVFLSTHKAHSVTNMEVIF